jgi:hypothetical protein
MALCRVDVLIPCSLTSLTPLESCDIGGRKIEISKVPRLPGTGEFLLPIASRAKEGDLHSGYKEPDVCESLDDRLHTIVLEVMCFSSCDVNKVDDFIGKDLECIIGTLVPPRWEQPVVLSHRKQVGMMRRTGNLIAHQLLWVQEWDAIQHGPCLLQTVNTYSETLGS